MGSRIMGVSREFGSSGIVGCSVCPLGTHPKEGQQKAARDPNLQIAAPVVLAFALSGFLEWTPTPTACMQSA